MKTRKAGFLNRPVANILILLSASVFISACSVITVPNPGDVIKHPLGTESIKLGMTKNQVESIWGKPTEVKLVEDKKRWPTDREMWIYKAQYGSIPVDAGYLSKTKKLYFDGENLTEISE